MRHVYDVAPRDGLTIGTTLRNTFFDPLMYPEQKRTVYPTKFTWLGSVNSETTVCVSLNSSNVSSFDDLKTKGMIVGGGFNPALTIEALAFMSAEAIVNRYRKSPGALL